MLFRSQSLQNKQSELQDRVQKTLEQLGQLKKDNQALPQPMDFPNTQTFEQNVKQSMQQTQSELNKGNTSGASQSQKQTAEDLSDLQKTMEEAAAESQEAEQSVNIQQLREIIDAVLQASFRQEDLMLQIKKLNISQPQIQIGRAHV